MSYLKLESKIRIEQNPSKLYPKRKLKFDFDFVHEFESSSSWSTLSDQGTLQLPRKINLVDGGTKKVITFDGKNLVGGSDPIIMRGDKIQVDLGYSNIAEVENVFSGYVTSIENDNLYTLSFQDATYLLKKIICPNKTFLHSKYDTKTMLRELIPLSVPINLDGVASIGISDFTTNNETVAQVLQRLEQDFKLKIYIRESTKGAFLYLNFFAYLPQDWQNPKVKDYDIFEFNYNIIESDLTFKSVEDTKIGLKVKSVFKINQGKATKKAKKDTFKTLESFVYKDQNGKTFFLDKMPSDFNGEVRTYFSYNAKTIKDLQKEAEYQLNRHNWDGYKGTFLVFGMPLVKQGRCIELRDKELPERNGFYLVKKVDYSFGMSGFRQKIEIDYKVGTSKTEVFALENKLVSLKNGV